VVVVVEAVDLVVVEEQEILLQLVHLKAKTVDLLVTLLRDMEQVVEVEQVQQVMMDHLQQVVLVV
jgi:hypothetical protein